MKKRVVITGLGVVSPIGVGVGEFWKAALAGSSGISAVAPFDTLPMDAFRSRVVGRVRDFNPAAHLDSGQADHPDRASRRGDRRGGRREHHPAGPRGLRLTPRAIDTL